MSPSLGQLAHILLKPSVCFINSHRSRIDIRFVRPRIIEKLARYIIPIPNSASMGRTSSRSPTHCPTLTPAPSTTASTASSTRSRLLPPTTAPAHSPTTARGRAARRVGLGNGHPVENTLPGRALRYATGRSQLLCRTHSRWHEQPRGGFGGDLLSITIDRRSIRSDSVGKYLLFFIASTPLLRSPPAGANSRASPS